MSPGNASLEQPSSKARPQLTRTASETTLVNPKQKMNSHKEFSKGEALGAYSSNSTYLSIKSRHHAQYYSRTCVTNTTMSVYIDSDGESTMTLKDESPEATSSSISKTMSKVKSKLKGSPQTQKKNTIYTPSSLSTWQALAGELLLGIVPLRSIRLTDIPEMK